MIIIVTQLGLGRRLQRAQLSLGRRLLLLLIGIIGILGLQTFTADLQTFSYFYELSFKTMSSLKNYKFLQIKTH